MKIIVIDGMGGGIGSELCSRLKDAAAHGGVELIALGTNSAATERMLKAGAHRGASGENAIRVMVPSADFIIGPIGIVIMDSLMGEISAAMVTAILASPAERVLLPLHNDHFHIVGITKDTLVKLLDEAVDYILKKIKAGAAVPQ